MTDVEGSQEPPEDSLEAKWGEPPEGIEEAERATHDAFQALQKIGVPFDANPMILRLRLETLIDMLCEQQCIKYWDYHKEFHTRLQAELQNAATELRQAQLTGNLVMPGTGVPNGMNRAARRRK